MPPQPPPSLVLQLDEFSPVYTFEFESSQMGTKFRSGEICKEPPFLEFRLNQCSQNGMQWHFQIRCLHVARLLTADIALRRNYQV